MPISVTLKHQFVLIFIVVSVIKLLIAHMLPMTGDEAYFIFWANYPDYGYYDHPPMVAWILTAWLFVSDATIWLRLPAIVFSMVIAALIYRVLRDDDPQLALYATIIYLLIPVNLLPVLMTTDTPLIWWSFLSGMCYYQAQNRDAYFWYSLCGVFLGLAFMSKFFSGLLALAFAIHVVLFVRRGIKPYIGLLLILIGLLPFIAINLFWNYNNCWNNYLFNLLNRTQGGAFSLFTFAKYLLILLYLLTPAVIWFLVKQFWQRNEVTQNKNKLPLFLILFLIPICLFGFLSFYKSIGLHWLFSFIPFLVLGIAKFFTTKQMRFTMKFMAVFAFLHISVLFYILLTIPGLFQSNEKLYKTLVIGTHTENIVKLITSFQPEYHLASDSYAFSANLAYHAGQHVMVFGEGSYHGRQDDLITDFRLLAGKNIIISSEVPRLNLFAKYFTEYELHTMSVEGAELYYALGKNFRYEKYRAAVLSEIRQRYYKLPAWLPQQSCYMDDRYAKPLIKIQ